MLRGGQRLFLDVPVAPPARLIPTTTYDEPVPYFIYGGLVFVPFTEPYLHEWGEEWQADAPHELVNLLLSGAAPPPKNAPSCPSLAAQVWCGTPTFTLSGIPSRPADQHQPFTPSTPPLGTTMAPAAHTYQPDLVRCRCMHR